MDHASLSNEQNDYFKIMIPIRTIYYVTRKFYALNNWDPDKNRQAKISSLFISKKDSSDSRIPRDTQWNTHTILNVSFQVYYYVIHSEYFENNINKFKIGP